MTVISKYPVFEADQVLSQSHLNSIISYFETQDRATRKGLIGIGIVCGLEVSFPTVSKIKISCGTAITSLGFQINWEEKIFSRYKTVDKLSDTFIGPNITQEPFLKSLFDYTSIYNSTIFSNFEELVEDTISQQKPNQLAQKALNTSGDLDINALRAGENFIPNARFLDGKVIALVLEVSLIDQKKCSETNCDDKGKRLEFNLRPILLNESKLVGSSFVNTSLTTTFESLHLERFNAPQITLINGQQVLNAFESKASNPQVLSQIDKKIKTLYTSFQDSYFTAIPNFSTLSNVNSKITEVIRMNRNKWHMQYVWDWVNDIVAAYNEIVDYNEKTAFSFCCSAAYDSKFPFHIFLGKIETRRGRFFNEETALQSLEAVARFAGNSDYNVIAANQNYSTPWIRVANKEKKDEKLALKILLERLVLILNNFSVITAQQTYLDHPVKVTPSLLGDYPLSKKAIPFYYSQIPQLSRTWNPKATIKGTTGKILSYHSAQYSSLVSSVYPLNYDLEPYNFFRIEGVIGRTYKQVLESLLSIRKTSQLPFNVVAINAVNLDNVVLNMSAYLGEWKTIELDYDLVRRNWESIIGKSIEWFEANSESIIPYFQAKQTPLPDTASGLAPKKLKAVAIGRALVQSQTSFDQFIALLKKGRNAMVESFSEFIKLYLSFMDTYDKIEKIASPIRKSIFDNLIQNEDNLFAEDLIDHLDEIIYACQKGEFRALYQAAQEQWDKTSRDLTLTKFIEKHPGLEHKAGVPKGGTFIIVYQDTSMITRKVIKPTTVAQPAAEAAVRKEVAAKNTAVGSLDVALKSDVFDVSIEEYRIKIKEYASNFLPQNSFNQLIHFMDNLLTVSSIKEDLYGIPNQTVIADFYLPYICCSDGSSINFVIADTNSGPADFNNPDFDQNDFDTNKTV